MTAAALDHHDHHHQEAMAKDTFGFWVYIMSDCILFSAIFATYIVLRHNTFGGPGAGDVASLPYVLTETMLLLFSSVTYGLGMLSIHKGNRKGAMMLISMTFILGASFLAMELNEFAHLIHEGNNWSRSAFLSGFFTLVGTHGLHVFIGLIWMVNLMIQLSMKGIHPITVKKLTCLGLFWHFLDIVWIFVFTIVYLMGAV